MPDHPSILSYVATYGQRSPMLGAAHHSRRPDAGKSGVQVALVPISIFLFANLKANFAKSFPPDIKLEEPKDVVVGLYPQLAVFSDPAVWRTDLLLGCAKNDATTAASAGSRAFFGRSASVQPERSSIEGKQFLLRVQAALTCCNLSRHI